MNPNHQTFLLEYYRTGDKKQAYRKAYPKTKEHCITNSVNRLMAREDIATAIREKEDKQRKAIETEIAERYRAEIIDQYEAQAYLSQIIRGQLKRDKWVKKKDHWETIQVTPTISETLRALNTFFRLHNQQQNQARHFERREKSPEHLQAASSEVPLPPEPPKTQPHPFGNIYPPNYPGPYYDPADPNTKEKMQNIRLTRLTGSSVTETTTNNNNQGRHSDSESIRKEEPPEHLQPAQPKEADSATTQRETSPPYQGGVPAGRGGDTQHGQTNNKIQQTPIPPVIASGSEAISRQHEQTTTNTRPQKTDSLKTYYRQKFEKQKQWKIKLEQLRKEGWETANELLNEVHDVYINNQHSGTYKMLKQFEKAVKSRNLPPEEREKITHETGREYHPEHPHVMRRKKRNM